MTVNPTFPVSQEMFRDIVRLHVYGRTNEAIAKELGLELRVILELRRDFAAEWDAAVESLIPAFTREMVFQTVAQIHILASLTTDVKELATLAHAEERHLRLVQAKKPRVKKPRPTPSPTSPTSIATHDEDTFTADEVAYVARLRAEYPNDLDYLCKLQQDEELYLKCFAAGILPAWPEPKPPSEAPPPAPPPDAPPKTFGQRLRSAAIVVMIVANLCVWGGDVRGAFVAALAPPLTKH